MNAIFDLRKKMIETNQKIIDTAQIDRYSLEQIIALRRKKIALLDKEIRLIKESFSANIPNPRKCPEYRRSIRDLLPERRWLSSFQRYDRLLLAGKITERRYQ